MSKNFKKYSYYYNMGFYNDTMLKMLIGKEGFTQEEYDLITKNK